MPWRYKHWGARHTTAWGKNNVDSSFYNNKRSSSSLPGPLLASWPENTFLSSKRDQNQKRASHHLSVPHKPPFKQYNEDNWSPFFLREDNQEHLLGNLALGMSIPRTRWAALPYLIQFSAMVAECLPWMGTIKNEVCLGLLTAQPPNPARSSAQAWCDFWGKASMSKHISAHRELSSSLNTSYQGLL